jgi:hypothetical protein
MIRSPSGFIHTDFMTKILYAFIVSISSTCDSYFIALWGEVSMGGYLPHINRLLVCLFVVYALVVRWNTTYSELHTTDATVPLRSFSSWTWHHWSLRRCQCDESSALCEVALGEKLLCGHSPTALIISVEDYLLSSLRNCFLSLRQHIL